mgnify:CR=1 FL=1
MKEVNASGIKILMNKEVKKLSMVNGQCAISFANDESMIAAFICIASGVFVN